MSKKNPKDMVQAALEIVIEGVASSEATEQTRAAGAYIVGLILADKADVLDAEKQKAILTIIQMACELDSPAFMSGA